MAKRKYISEFALNMHLTHTMVLQQEELELVKEYNYFNSSNPCHIYLICKRPRILINTDIFFVDDKKIIFAFKIQHQDTFKKIEITVQNIFGTSDLQLVSTYPYNFFELKNGDEIILQGKSSLLLHHFENEFLNCLDLEILYIGQSYGIEGARTAPDRLKSHSTLQGIYSEAINKNPDCEIFLVLTSFEQVLLTFMDGTIPVSVEENKNDKKHLKSVTNTVLKEGLKEQQVINFTEAALIRYFQPPYNIEYKDTFPSPAHSTYSECYDLDINSICIELETDNINCRLYSRTIDANWLHIKDFFLHSREDRKSMFDFRKF